jgi:hypothetical protein
MIRVNDIRVYIGVRNDALIFIKVQERKSNAL